jgi:hypothetical protein
MPSTAKLTPHVLAILRGRDDAAIPRICMKCFQFPAPIPGISQPLHVIMLVAGAV